VLSACILAITCLTESLRECGIVKHAYERGFIHGTCENTVLVLTSAMTIMDFLSTIDFFAATKNTGTTDFGQS